jgi:hypothetical protein
MADESSYAARVFPARPQSPSLLPPRDALLEMLRPGMLASGNPAAAATGDPLTEGFPTGQAGLYDRLAMLAQYFGNALPFRGAINFRETPGFRDFLRRMYREHLSKGDTALPPNMRIPEKDFALGTIEPGGWEKPPGPARELRLERGMKTTPERQAIDLELYEKMLKERGYGSGARQYPHGPAKWPHQLRD